ncbi:MAG: glycosyltransferase family 2 protein [Bacteroidales bacterium]
MILSVVIVNYNVKFFLEQCLQSVFASGKNIDMEVFVVDNNSVDGSVPWIREKFPQVKIIANKQNVGFSKANNQAIQQSKGKYVLLLNPDTVVEDHTFEKVLDFMEKTPDAGGLGVKMIDGNGDFLPESKRGLPTPSVAFYKIFGLAALFPKSKIFGKYHLGFLDNQKIHQVDVLSGAFMLLRRSALEKSGYLDETFFMYGEDIDLSYRIVQAGYKNYYFPQTRIIHYKGESTKKSSINYVFVFYNAMIIFAQKHFSKKNARLFSFFINIAIYFRAFIAILNRFFNRIFTPLLDAGIAFAGMYFIKEYWEANIFNFQGNYYPPEFMYIFVPAYILVWLFSVYISGGYDKPLKLFRIIRGIGLGTVIILVIYALLPLSLRFSRALILLGGLWVMVSMLTTRMVWHLLQFKNLNIGQQHHKRIAIIGKGTEPHRVALMLRQSGSSAFIGFVSTASTKPDKEGYLGTINQLNEIIEVYNINELIFCASEMSSQSIISIMSGLHKKTLHYKIAPPESLFIIGSNSIDTFDDFFTVDINTLNQPANKRNKKLFDVLTNVFMIFLLPVHLLIIPQKKGLLKNITDVITGKKTWVGYHPGAPHKGLPSIKPSVLNPADAFSDKDLDITTLKNLNTLYAKDYRIDHDFRIFRKAYKRLGQRW